MNPQVAATFRISDRFAVGLAVVAPHADGSNTWPESVGYTNAFGVSSTQPAPQRYLLVRSDAMIVTPTISVAYAPLRELSFGVGFLWGLASIDYLNFAAMTSSSSTGNVDHGEADIRSRLRAHDWFVPGFVASALWSPTEKLDVSGWFKWQDAIRATPELTLEALYFTRAGLPNANVCQGNPLGPSCNVTHVSAGSLTFPIPMEAKLGLRYHEPRQGDGAGSPGGRRVRDPMHNDRFDLEVDFTWANNSAIDAIEARFPSGIRINDGSSGGIGELPTNADIPHHYRDVMGLHVGGDYVMMPDRMAVRAGFFHERAGQDDAYLNLDFDAASKTGLSGGVTVRVGRIDISLAYQHTFFGTLDNHGRGRVYALSGSAAGLSPGPGGEPPACGLDSAHPKVGPGCFRTSQAVNGGTLRESLDELGLAATMRF